MNVGILKRKVDLSINRMLIKNFREKWKLLKIQLTQHQPCFFIKLVTNSLDFIESCNNFDKIMLN